MVILDMKEMSNVTDFFVIASGSSGRQVQAVADAIEEILTRRKARLRQVEGYEDALWVVLDYGDVIAHVFLQEKREFYDLEHLWGLAPRRYPEKGREGVAPLAPKKK